MLLEEGEGGVRMNSGAVLFYLIESAIAIRELDSLSSKVYLWTCGMRTESDAGSMMQPESTLGKTRCQRVLAFWGSYFSPA